MNGIRQSMAGQARAHHEGRLTLIVKRLERDVVSGVDHAADFLLSPFAIDFRGWSLGDARNETWM